MKYGILEEEMQDSGKDLRARRDSHSPSDSCSCSSCDFEVVIQDSETGEVSCRRKEHVNSFEILEKEVPECPAEGHGIEGHETHEIEQQVIHEIEQQGIHEIEQQGIHAIEQQVIHEIEQHGVHEIDKPKSHEIKKEKIDEMQNQQVQQTSIQRGRRPGSVLEISLPPLPDDTSFFLEESSQTEPEDIKFGVSSSPQIFAVTSAADVSYPNSSGISEHDYSSGGNKSRTDTSGEYEERYVDIVRRLFGAMQLGDIVSQTQTEFLAYCKGWFECETGRGSDTISNEAIGQAGGTYVILRSAVHNVEKLFEQNSMLAPSELSEHLISFKNIEFSVPRAFSQILCDRLNSFAMEYERRNLEGIQNHKHESYQRIVQAAVFHVEEELRVFLDHYAEPDLLNHTCDQVIATTLRNFQESCGLPAEEKENYLHLLDSQLKTVVEAIKRRNEQLLAKTEADLEHAVDLAMESYRKFMTQKLNKLRGPKWQLALMCGAHETVMYEVLQEFCQKFLQTWSHCPALCESARKKLVAKLMVAKQNDHWLANVPMFQVHHHRKSPSPMVSGN